MHTWMNVSMLDGWNVSDRMEVIRNMRGNEWAGPGYFGANNK